jgi:RNA-directed DNA polymerase
MESIFSSLRNNSGDKGYHKYILDADISKCFDRIDHDYLLKKMATLPEIEQQVRAWLKAGIMEELQKDMNFDVVPENKTGTPQGVISPLLSNIALHGLEDHMKTWICTKPSYAKTNQYSKSAKRKSLALIRYADDFVVIHKDEGIIREAREEIAAWLWDGPKLELSEEKTSVRHSSEGFNFLGFSCITIRRGNRERIKIYPSRSSQARLLLKVRVIVLKNRSASSYQLVKLLRPVILGWANYFKFSECKAVFHTLTHLIFQKLRAWCFRRDTRNGRKVVKEKYFPSGRIYSFDGVKHADNWVLVGKEKSSTGIMRENHLPHIVWVKSVKWVKIKGDASPFDGNNVYWGRRTMNKGTFNVRQRKLIRVQKGICPWCQTPFFFESIVEVDHIEPTFKGGEDVYKNLQLLHKHCHIEKTRVDLSS